MSVDITPEQTAEIQRHVLAAFRGIAGTIKTDTASAVFVAFGVGIGLLAVANRSYKNANHEMLLDEVERSFGIGVKIARHALNTEKKMGLKERLVNEDGEEMGGGE